MRDSGMCRGKNTAAQTCSWQGVLLVPCQVLEWCELHSIGPPCCSCHPPLLLCNLPSRQLCCEDLGGPGAASSPEAEYMQQEGWHTAPHRPLSQPAASRLGQSLAQLSICSQGRMRLGKGPPVTGFSPGDKNFSRSPYDPSVGFRSPKTIITSWAWGRSLFPLGTKATRLSGV